MNISVLFKKRFEVAKERGWEQLIVAVDLHDTIIDSRLFNVLGSLEEAITGSILPEAILPLRHLSNRKDIKLMWYTGTNATVMCRIADILKIKFGIKFEGDVTSLNFAAIHSGQEFEKKPCFDILLDDKAGFDPTTDWKEVAIALSKNVL